MEKGAVGVDHPIVQKKIDKSLKLSVREGATAASASGFGLSYLAPFALALEATASQMGILHALTSLLPSIVQLKAASLIKKFSRKKIALTAISLRLLLWIPIFLVGMLFYFGIPHLVWILIFLISLCYTVAAVIHPVWFSWMGSLVPENGRGVYFSKRNRIAGLSGIVVMIIGAIILDFSKKLGEYYGDILGFTLLGFGLLFFLSAFFKLWSRKLLKNQYEPRLKVRKKDYFTFRQFLKKCHLTPFGRFCLYRGFFSFAISIATPFWAVYMLRDLSFSYVWYIAITVSGIIFQLMFLPLHGKFSDKFGNIKLMQLCSWIIVIIPFVWLASAFIGNGLNVRLYLLFVPSIMAGFAWAGHNLAVNNYVYDAVTTPKRSFGLSYMNLIVGIGIFLGASLGSLLAWIGVSILGYSLLIIFAISGIFRLLVTFFGLKFLNEVRYVKKFSSEFLIREFQPIHGIISEIHNLEHLVKKVEHYK